MVFRILLLVATCSTVAFSTCEKDFRVVCYWGTWSYYRKEVGLFTPQNIDPHLCDTIVYSFFGLNEDFKLDHLDTVVDIDKKAIAETVALKQKNPCLKVNLAVGGWNEGSIKYSVMAAFEETRKEFAMSVLKVLTYYGFDGVDLDWEYPGSRGGIADDEKNFVQLLQVVKQTIKPWNLKLSVAVGVQDEMATKAYDVANIAKIVDHVHVMAYDYSTPNSGVTGLSSPMSSINKTVHFWTSKGLKNSQLILGIPTYARAFQLTNATQHGIGDPAVPGEKGPWTQEDGFLAYYEVLYLKKNVKYIEVQVDGTIYSYFRNDWLSYENQETVEIKANWVKENKFAGVAVWSIDTDDARGKYGKKYPLLTAINDILKPQTL